MKTLSFCVIVCLINFATTSGKVISVPSQERTVQSGNDAPVSGNLAATAKATNAASLGTQQAEKRIEDFVSPDGRTDIDALKASGQQGPLDRWGFDAQFDPRTGEPLFSPATRIDSLSDHPDDIYWDNSLSASLPGADGTIYAMMVYGDDLVVCGDFSVIGDVSARNIAIWNGSSWSALGEGVLGRVMALSVYHDKIIAAGDISLGNGQPAQNIAAWDGTSWSPLGESGPNGVVLALTVYEDRLIAAGSFGIIGSDTVNHIASWDGSAWSPLGSGINGNVYSLVEYDHKLYAGGGFGIAGGATASNIASWDGTEWASLGTGIRCKTFAGVRTLTVFQDKLIAGGWFYSAGGKTANSVASWDGISWSTLAADLAKEQIIRSLVVIDNKLVAAGLYEKSNDVIIQSIQYWDGTVWSPWEEWESDHYASTLTVYNNKLVASGNLAFPALDYQGQFSEVSFWEDSSWKPFYGTGFNSYVGAFTIYRDNLIAAGSFTSAGGIPINHIASWNGFSWSALGSGLSTPGNISALEVYEDKLYAAGNFTQAGNEPVSYIASWDGSNWERLGETGLDSTVGVLVVYNGELIVGGRFTTADGKLVNHVAAWDGDSWETLGPGLNGQVLAMTVFNDTLIATGYFSASGNEPVGRLVRWDGTDWATIDYPDSLGYAIGLSTFRNKLIGVFITYSGGGWVSLPTIASWDGSIWTPLQRWSMPAGLNVSLAVYDGNLIAGGYFYNVAANIVRWDGSTWQPLGSGMSGGNSWFSPVVYSLTVYNGDLIAGGSFTKVGSKFACYLAAWTKHETHKVALDVKPGSCPNTLNAMNQSGHSKAVLPVAILGADDFDVYDIDPESITLNGTSPFRWSYEDVGTPVDKVNDSCACTEDGADGYEDLVMKLDRDEIIASLNISSQGQLNTTTITKGTPQISNISDNYIYNSGPPIRTSNILKIEGQLNDGSMFEGYDCVTLMTKVEKVALISSAPEQEFELKVNNPNPFNSMTRISFYLPERQQVELQIYNILGQKVATLINQTMDAGEHSVRWDASKSASGMYLYRIQAGKQVETKRMILLK